MYYILNTNFTNNTQDHAHMLAHGRAAAFYDRKSKIDSLQRGNKVFLYQSGIGVVALGTADGNLVVRDHEADRGEEHRMKLTGFKYVSPHSRPGQGDHWHQPPLHANVVQARPAGRQEGQRLRPRSRSAQEMTSHSPTTRRTPSHE
jgi:hypothetical protein